MRLWLEVFNSADEPRLAAFIRDVLAPPKQGQPLVAGEEVEFSTMVGGFELKKVEESSPRRCVALLKEGASDTHARVTVELEDAPPYRIVNLDVQQVETPDAVRPTRLSEADAIAGLRAQIDAAVAADRFSGAVLVAKNGRPIFTDVRGMADREAKVPITLESRFRLGSMNKMFTATAIMQLVQAKKIALDDTVGKLLPDYPNKEVASKVTVHHLLGHTGGTGDIFGPEYRQRRGELRAIGDYVKLYGERAPLFEPGSRFEYSNYGFILLGAIIEKVTGKSYYDRVQSAVFAPAGMKRTSSPPEEKNEPGRVVPYTHFGSPKAWVRESTLLPYRGTSAGGGDSTVTDLLAFANALGAHKLLDTKHTELLTTRKDDKRGYAYGFEDYRNDKDGVRCIGHGGGAPGMNGDLRICTSGYTVVVLSNVDPRGADLLAQWVVPRLPVK
jgi:CubicO group peptidase (beta-lactamase class C family)